MKSLIYKRSLIEWFWIILSIVMGVIGIWLIVTFAVAVSYTFPSAIDDVSTAMSKKNNMETYHVNAIGAGMIQAWSSYKTWQGIYFTQAIDTCLMPIDQRGIIQTVPFRIYMVSFFSLFVCSLFYFMWSLVRQVMGKEHILENILICFTVFFFLLTVVKPWREPFYWFQGMICYTFPISMFFIVWGMVLQNKEKQGRGVFIAASVIAFLASGSALVVPAMGCYILLLMVIFYAQKKGIGGVFAVSVLGALINTAAPGNFRRKNIIDATGFHLGHVFKVSLEDYIASVKGFLEYKYAWIFWLGLLLLVFLGFTVKKRIDIKKLLCLNILSLPLPWIVAFPAELGYAGGGIPNRVIFCVDITVLGIFMIIAFSTGYIVGNICKKNKALLTCLKGGLIAVSIILFVVNVRNTELVYLVNVDTYQQLKDGSIQTFSQGVLDIYEYIEKTEEKNIVINQIPTPIRNYEVFVFAEDPEHAMWVKLCRYYNKESLRYEKKDQ